jgi:SdrD B-like domain
VILYIALPFFGDGGKLKKKLLRGGTSHEHRRGLSFPCTTKCEVVGTVYDNWTTGMSGMDVFLKDSTNAKILRSTTTDANGYYIFAPIKAGVSYNVVAKLFGYTFPSPQSIDKVY